VRLPGCPGGGIDRHRPRPLARRRNDGPETAAAGTRPAAAILGFEAGR
jgi:hypothetical protein